MDQVSAPNLSPLVKSGEYDDIESELKQVFLDLFAEHLRELERDINVSGAPHLGSLSLVERHVSRDGLALTRSDDPSMRYLFKAWKARNPKRGMHFLRTYLQLIYPNGWIVEQLWQDKAQTYPLGLVARGAVVASEPTATHYLTSRIRVSIDDIGGEGENFINIIPALRAVVPAKFVLEIVLLKRFETDLAISNGAVFGNIGHFVADIAPSINLGSEPSLSNGLGLHQFVGFSGQAVLG